jgi:Skp family chaperone for outer membrane proteins
MRLHHLVASAALAACTVGTPAQTPLKPQMSSREDYRACLAESDDLKKRQAELKEESVAHDARLKRLQDEMRAHVDTQPKVGASDDAAVDAFNEKLKALNARVDASNQEAERLNLEAFRHNTRIAQTNKRCAGMVVSQADHEAVTRERAAAAKGR